jgi:hypothetical protein
VLGNDQAGHRLEQLRRAQRRAVRQLFRQDEVTVPTSGILSAVTVISSSVTPPAGKPAPSALVESIKPKLENRPRDPCIRIVLSEADATRPAVTITIVYRACDRLSPE